MDIIHASSENFDSVIRDNKLVLVDFWASWCGPCRMLAPVIEELAQKFEDKLTVVKVDVDEQQALAAQFGVQSIPTVVLFQDGEQLWTEIGAKSLAHYEELINQQL